MAAPPPINALPIVFSPLIPPVGTKAMNLTQLLTIICQYIQGSVQQNVFFVLEFSSPPGFYNGKLIFVDNINNFMAWDNVQGTYVALNQFSIGAVVQQAVIYGATTYDDLVNGFIYLNGRTIASIAGLSMAQTDNLNTLFPNGTLPNVQPLAVFPIGQMAIVGSVTSGTGFVDAETVTQTTSGATATVYGGQGPGIGNLVITALTGIPNATDVWTGGTSGTVFTPTAVPTVYFGPYPVVSRVYVGTNIPQL